MPSLRTRLSQLKLLFWRQKSYAQLGEDLQLDHYFTARGEQVRTYLEIGGYHPAYLSNTYKFYRRGARGVVVEPQSFQCQLFQWWRPRDTVLNAGVGMTTAQGRTFYELNPLPLSTFEKVAADEAVEQGHATLAAVREVPIVAPQQLIDDYFPDRAPDVLSLDVEGGEQAILEAWPWKKKSARPRAIVLETLDFTTQTQRMELGGYLSKQGYTPWACTHVNTIFVDKKQEK
jgi:hypothetical protein